MMELQGVWEAAGFLANLVKVAMRLGLAPAKISHATRKAD